MHATKNLRVSFPIVLDIEAYVSYRDIISGDYMTTIENACFAAPLPLVQPHIRIGCPYLGCNHSVICHYATIP